MINGYGRLISAEKLIGDVSTSAKLAIYRYHVKNGTVPKSIPAWAKKKMEPKVKALPKEPIYPSWTYKQAMKNVSLYIPGQAREGDKYDGTTIENYVIEFDRLNYLLRSC